MITIDKKVKISGIVGFLILSSIFIANISFSERNNSRSTLNPTASASWAVNAIHVQNNWSDTASTYAYCTGDGSWETPYLIENVTVAAATSPTDSGILIEDSKGVYFEIRNCLVYGWGAGFEDGGIKLLNADNGVVKNNTCYGSASGSGIVLMGALAGAESSNNNTIHDNSVYDNAARGILVELYCEDNNIYDNEVDNNNVGISLFDHCSNNNITDNSITDNSWGVELAYSSNDNKIDFNEMESNQWGIHMHEECDDNYLYNNTITASTSSGIYILGEYLKSCTGNIIDKNFIANNIDDGIQCEYTEYSTITNNIIIDNNRVGMYFRWHCDWNNIMGNTINSNGDGANEAGIYMLANCYNNNITLNNIFENYNFGINLAADCDMNLINENTIERQDWGVRIYSSCDHNTIISNTISDCSGPVTPYGVLVEYQTYTVIANNIINNTETGVWVKNFSNETDIITNTISNCTRGIYFSTNDCVKNEVWDNRMHDNTEHARDNSAVGATDFHKNSNGNYWDDYSGIDCDGDGIGDTAYNIPGSASSIDNYPLWTQPLPILTEHNIESGVLFTTAPPVFYLTVEVYIFEKAYYRLSDGSTLTNNQSIATTGTNVTIDPGLWNQMDNGTVLIMFYAEDPCAYVGYYEVEVRKDILGPQIHVSIPSNNSECLLVDRNFEYTVDGTQDTVWYSIEAGPDHIVTSNGLFDQTEWETAWNATALDDYFMIEFFANDTHGNIASVVIYVSPTTNEPVNKIPFGYTFLLVGFVAVVTVGILVNRKISIK